MEMRRRGAEPQAGVEAGQGVQVWIGLVPQGVLVVAPVAMGRHLMQALDMFLVVLRGPHLALPHQKINLNMAWTLTNRRIHGSVLY